MRKTVIWSLLVFFLGSYCLFEICRVFDANVGKERYVAFEEDEGRYSIVGKASNKFDSSSDAVFSSMDNVVRINIVGSLLKYPLDFEKASFYAVDVDNKVYQLHVINSKSGDSTGENYVLNPYDNIEIICQVPNRLNDPLEIKGFKVKVPYYGTFYFGSEPQSFWSKLIGEILGLT